MPQRICETRPIQWLLEQSAIVICAGGGGIPILYRPDGTRLLMGVEAVIDKDFASALLARELDAALLVLATDVDGVHPIGARPRPGYSTTPPLRNWRRIRSPLARWSPRFVPPVGLSGRQGSARL